MTELSVVFLFSLFFAVFICGLHLVVMVSPDVDWSRLVWDKVLTDICFPAYMPVLKVCSSWWKCWVGSDKTWLELRQGCQTRPRLRETSLTRLTSGSPSMHTDWFGSYSTLSSETVRTRRLEPRSREMATKLWDHMM